MTIRRQILALGAAGLVSPALLAQAPRKPLRLAWFSGGTEKDHRVYIAAFRKGMEERGYQESRDYVIEYFWRGETIKPYSWLVRDVVGAKPDMILATCEVTAEAAKKATGSIPIVLTAATDPVAAGLVPNLGRPGGNVTGVSSALVEVSIKRIELLKQIVPSANRVALLRWRYEVVSKRDLQMMEAAAGNQGMSVAHYEPEDEAGYVQAFADMAATRVSGMVDLAGLSVSFPYLALIPELALRHRIPAVHLISEIVERGGLVSYGPSIADEFRRSAQYVDRLAKGARAGDLPIEQPSVFETWVNQRTASALGIRIPESILLRAQRVIN